MIKQLEAYLYNKYLPDQVIVGSGLVAGLEKTQPFSEFFTLSWPYYGSCAAIEVIALSKRIPRILLVEINFIFKGCETELTAHIFRRRFWHPKFLMNFLRHKYWLVQLFKKFENDARKNLDPTLENQSPDLSSLDFFRAAYDVMPSPEPFKNNLIALKKNIDEIESQGCQIIFFEMPMEKSLTHARLFCFQRVQLKNIFGSGAGQWIELDESQDYSTTDCLHLTGESFLRYAQYLSGKFHTITN